MGTEKVGSGDNGRRTIEELTKHRLEKFGKLVSETLKKKYKKRKETKYGNINRGFTESELKQFLGSEEYWMDLWDFVKNFMKRPESKFYRNTGFLKRKHIIASRVKRIGKEITDLDKHIIKNVYPQEYIAHEHIKDIILNMDAKDAKQNGVSRQALYAVKKQLRSGKRLKRESKVVQKLLT